MLQGTLMFALQSALLAAAAQPVQAQTYSVLYTFCSMQNCGDGAEPSGGLILGANGNLYGATSEGGDPVCVWGCGTVFQLTPSGTETVLYKFSGGVDGAGPSVGLIADAQGNFYGATYGGGTYNRGTAFELSSSGTETVLHSFHPHGLPSAVPRQGGWLTDGFGPKGRLLMDAPGNLYGTTYYGGDVSACHFNGCGTVFEITATGSEKILYRFTGSQDGAYPWGGLVMDAQGNLYGTTYLGGAHGSGTVFELTATGTEKVLYSFCSVGACSDGAYPMAGLVMDAQGNLYGTTEVGGKSQAWCDAGCGTVFKLAPNGTETVLLSFVGPPDDGAFPGGSLVFDTQGNLYGTTVEGGAYIAYGTVFKLTPNHTETVLYSFTGGADGGFPMANLILDAQGNLYGTTVAGGNSSSTCFYNNQCGVVFKLTP